MMTKKELKKAITEAFNQALMAGETKFKVDAKAGEMELVFKPDFGISRVLWIDLNFGSGMIRLMPKECSHKDMIRIFTDGMWAIFFNHED